MTALCIVPAKAKVTMLANFDDSQSKSTHSLLPRTLLLSIFFLVLTLQPGAEAEPLPKGNLQPNEFAVQPGPRFDYIQNLMITSTVCLHWYSTERIRYISNRNSATPILWTYEKILKEIDLEKSKQLLVVILHPQARDITELPRPLTQDKNQIESLQLMGRQTAPLLTPLGFARTVVLGYGMDGTHHPSYLVISDKQR